MLQQPPDTTLFPYTTLFRSYCGGVVVSPRPSCGSACARGRAARSRGPRARREQRVHRRVGDAAHVALAVGPQGRRSEEHTSELQSHVNLVCRLLLEKKKKST